MKKIYKKLGAIGVAALPTATVLSCTEINTVDPSILDPDQTTDQAIVEMVISNINNLNKTIKEESKARSMLPSEIRSPTEIKEAISSDYFKTSDSLTNITVAIKSPDDRIGRLTVRFTVTRGQVIRQTDVTLKGFLTINERTFNIDITDVIDEISLSPGTVNSEGQAIVPSAITTQLDLEKTVTNFPTNWKTGAIKIVATPEKADNEEGTLIVRFEVSEWKVKKEVKIPYYGFGTNNSINETIVYENIDYIKGLPKTATLLGSQILPSTINSQTEMENNITGFPLKTIKGAEVTAIRTGYNDTTGTLDVKYTVTKGLMKRVIPPIHYTGFQTILGDDTVQVQNNIEAIKKLPSLAKKEAETVWATTIKTDSDIRQYINFPTPTGGVTIRAFHFAADDENGVIVVTFEVSKGNATSAVNHTYSGFMQSRFINSSQKVNLEPNVLTNVYNGWTQKINDTHYLIGTTDKGVYQVTTDETTGDIVQSIQYPMTSPSGENNDYLPSVQTGWSQEISQNIKEGVAYYLIGTYDDGVYEVTVSLKTGLIMETTRISMTPDKLPAIANVRSGFITKIGQTDNYYFYLVGTYDRGTFKVAVDPKNGKIDPIRTEQVANSIIPNVQSGWVQQINDTHAIVGTAGAGLYQVWSTMDAKNDQLFINSQRYVTEWSQNVSQGWMQYLTGSSFLIGTNQNGIYQIQVDLTNGFILNGTAQQLAAADKNNTLLKVNTGWGQRVDSDRYLIGSHHDGVYKLIYKPQEQKVTWILPIPMAGELSIPDVGGGFAQQIGNTNNYWVGTLNQGLYKVKINHI